MSTIVVSDLKKTFKIKKREFHAVSGLTFAISAGERVAFVGPNGAGKSTTIKMLSGILFPTSGDIRVMGLVPWKDRKRLAYRIGTVFGQRSQLWIHLPASDTFDLLARIYDQDLKQYQTRRTELVKRFEITHVLQKPVRQLSLGERMRCEIVASLLHAPDILFLDEPTIGLDVTAKAIIRDLIKDRSQSHGTTLLLTSHDTGDMERVCDRVLVINEGRLLLDQPILSLRQQYIRRKVVTLMTAEPKIDLPLAGTACLESSPHRLKIAVDTNVTPIERVVEAAMRASPLRDLTVEDPPMEEIVQEIYSGARRP